MEYPKPKGVHPIPLDSLDLRPDDEIDYDLLHPGIVKDEKNIWFFWLTGYASMYGYTQRNIRAWHRRFAKQGWVVRVLDRQPGSLLNVANFLDTQDPALFPQAFSEGTLTGTYAAQHNSDLVRWPLLLEYGGIYADVGMIQIGDVDRLWNATVGDPDTPYEVMSYVSGSADSMGRCLTNYFLGCHKDNPFFERWHRLLLSLWAADGGKTSTEGMHASPLFKGLPMMGGNGLAFEEDGKHFSEDETSKMLTDYIIQGQVSDIPS